MDHLEKLDDDCLITLFEQLPQKQLFKMLAVNRRMNRLASEKMRDKIKVIVVGQSNRLSECIHLGDIGREQVLFLSLKIKKESANESVEEASRALMDTIVNFKPKEKSLDETFRDSPTRNGFLGVLSKCSGVKSIDFGEFELPNGFLLEVFKLCPELDCIKFGEPVVKEDEWQRVMDQFGHKIVHFQMWPSGFVPREAEELVLKMGSRLVEMIAAKCNNIKEVTLKLDYMMGWSVTRYLMAALKLLPKSCWITLHCDTLNGIVEGYVFQDVVNDLYIETLNWSTLGTRIDRLSKLWFYSMENSDGHGVDFAVLKVLVFTNILESESVNCLIASRFPLLEEFSLNAAGITEADYNGLFQKMASLKKLTILYDLEYGQESQLPQAAIRLLNNLETIFINILEVPDDWHPDDFVKQIEQYVDKIISLKNLAVKSVGLIDEWRTMVENEVERLKMKQNRVDVYLVREDN